LRDWAAIMRQTRHGSAGLLSIVPTGQRNNKTRCWKRSANSAPVGETKSLSPRPPGRAFGDEVAEVAHHAHDAGFDGGRIELRLAGARGLEHDVARIGRPCRRLAAADGLRERTRAAAVRVHRPKLRPWPS